jgi:hypothetical protein
MRQPAPKTSLEFQSPNAAVRIEGTIPVRAKSRGFYDHHVKEPGEVFKIREQDALGSWMELVEEEQPVVAQSAGGEQPVEAEQKTKGKKAKTKTEHDTADDVL